MALTKCPECNNQISKSAKSCPHCGHTKKERRPLGCGAFIVVVVVGWTVLSTFTPDSPSTATKEVEAKPKTAEQLRYEEIKPAFSAWSGAHTSLERHIKKQRKDPDSYEHVETKYVDNGDTLTLYTTYRAKNSFGGYVMESAVATAKIDGTLLTFEATE